jgi:hypothetical protein
LTWALLEKGDPGLAAAGYGRLHGRVSYLATVSQDGAPRVHPVTPIIGEGRLFLFMEPTSPKGRDLRRGSAFALHCGVEDTGGGEGEFFVTGHGRAVEDAATRALAVKLAPYTPADRSVLFELEVESVIATTYASSGPARRRWNARRS